MDNDGWGKGWADEVTEGVSTEPKWPDEVQENNIAIELDGQTIPARIVGDLAIHDSVGNSDYFCITHVPTLTDFMKAVPVEQYQEYETFELVDWCEKVQEQHQQFWQVLRELTPLTVNRNTDRDMKAKDTIKVWCLSMSIKE